MTDVSPNNDRFLWRGDPDETFSDWTLEIVSDKVTEDDEGNIISPDSKKARSSVETTVLNGKIVQKYFVHRAVLISGIRKSTYFASQFLHAKQGRCHESVTHSSRVEFPHLAAAVIPTLLDYLYCSELKLGETGLDQRALVALHYLADYFEIDSLRNDSLDELKLYLERREGAKSIYGLKDNGGLKVIYSTAVFFFDDAVISLLANFFAENLRAFSTKHELIECASVDFWLKVASEMRSLCVDYRKSDHWSNVVVEISKHHVDDFTHEMFKKMTDVDILPTVSREAARPLLKLKAKLESAAGASDDSEKEDILNFQISFDSRCRAALLLH